MFTSPSSPYFVFQLDDFDAVVFGDLRELGGILEPPDLKSGDFVLFDSTGRRGTLEIDGWDVVATGWHDTTSLDEFHSLLRRIIAEGGEIPSSNETPHLVSHGAAIAQRLQQDRRSPFRAWRRRRG